MKLNPKNVLALLDEVAAAKTRAAELQKHHTLTLAEKLDIWKGADQAAANRFDVVAQAYRELLKGRDTAAGYPPRPWLAPKLHHIYQHYKGERYMALANAKEEATGRELVVYQGVNDSQVWVRPLEEFQPPRFELLP